MDEKLFLPILRMEVFVLSHWKVTDRRNSLDIKSKMYPIHCGSIDSLCCLWLNTCGVRRLSTCAAFRMIICTAKCRPLRFIEIKICTYLVYAPFLKMIYYFLIVNVPGKLFSCCSFNRTILYRFIQELMKKLGCLYHFL